MNANDFTVKRIKRVISDINEINNGLKLEFVNSDDKLKALTTYIAEHDRSIMVAIIEAIKLNNLSQISTLVALQNYIGTSFYESITGSENLVDCIDNIIIVLKAYCIKIEDANRNIQIIQ